jgi:hypothetical protein
MMNFLQRTVNDGFPISFACRIADEAGYYEQLICRSCFVLFKKDGS